MFIVAAAVCSRRSGDSSCSRLYICKRSWSSSFGIDNLQSCMPSFLHRTTPRDTILVLSSSKAAHQPEPSDYDAAMLVSYLEMDEYDHEVIAECALWWLQNHHSGHCKMERARMDDWNSWQPRCGLFRCGCWMASFIKCNESVDTQQHGVTHGLFSSFSPRIRRSDPFQCHLCRLRLFPKLVQNMTSCIC